MLHAITGGYEARHPSPYQMSRPDGLPHYVLLIIRSGGEFQLGEASYSARPGDALVIAPGTSYYYGNPQGDYVDDWLHFSIEDCPLKEQLDHLANVPFPIGNTELYTFCIRQLLWEHSYGHPDYAGENTDCLFQLLFNHLFAAWQTRNNKETALPYYNELQLVRLDAANHFSQRHSIGEISRRLGISESYFQYLYKKHFGISFHRDLIRMRIDHARYTLLTSSLPIDQVAELCGYSNEVHFYRQFKKITGVTPSEFRNGEKMTSKQWKAEMQSL